MAESEIRTSPVDRVVRHLGIDHTVESVRIDRRGARAVLRSAAGETREIDCRFEDAVWHLSTYGLDLDQDTTTTLRPNYHTRMRVEMTDETAQRIRYLSGARGVSVDELVEKLVYDAMEGEIHAGSQLNSEKGRKHHSACRSGKRSRSDDPRRDHRAGDSQR